MARDQVVITAANSGPLIQILITIFLILLVLGFGARLVVKLVLVRGLHLDDGYILVAFIICCGQTALLFKAVEFGLGQATDSLSSEQVTHFQQALYAYNILYIMVLLMTKLAAIYFVMLMAPIQKHLDFSYWFAGILCAWTVGSVFAASFECGKSSPWDIDSDKCISLPGFWIAYNAISIISEIVLIVWPCFIVLRLNALWERRKVIVLCFSTRLLVIGATIAQLVMTPYGYSGTNRTQTLQPLLICAQLVLMFSIVIAGVPYLKPFFESMESGFLRNDDLRRRGMTSDDGYGGYGGYGRTVLGTNASGKRRSRAEKGKSKSVSMPTPNLGLFPDTAHETSVVGSSQIRPRSSGKDSAGDSQNSHAHIIHHTRSWTIDWEQRQSASASTNTK